MKKENKKVNSPNKNPYQTTEKFPQVELISTLYTPEQLVPPAELQIALAGRSNVGKSSLLNALAQRKSLAKVSSTPGKTRSLNFFLVKPQNFYLVDLPGYGYAQRSKTERDAWAQLINQYLENTQQLQALLVLIDGRLEPQNLDKEMIAFATQLGINVLPLLTKCDKVSQKEIAINQNFWCDMTGIVPLAVSANTGLGLKKLWELLCYSAGTTLTPEPNQPENIL